MVGAVSPFDSARVFLRIALARKRSWVIGYSTSAAHWWSGRIGAGFDGAQPHPEKSNFKLATRPVLVEPSFRPPLLRSNPLNKKILPTSRYPIL